MWNNERTSYSVRVIAKSRQGYIFLVKFLNILIVDIIKQQCQIVGAYACLYLKNERGKWTIDAVNVFYEIIGVAPSSERYEWILELWRISAIWWRLWDVNKQSFPGGLSDCLIPCSEMIAEQGQFEGSDWLSAVSGRGLARASDAIRWTAAEDSLWSFSTVEPSLSKLNDTTVPVIIGAYW